MSPKKKLVIPEIKITIIGEWKFNIYEEAFAKGLEMNGVKVQKISLKEIIYKELSKFEYLVPYKSKKTIKINQYIIKKIKQINPDFALFWRPTHILNSTIVLIKEMGVKTISYNNDNPFNNNLYLPMRFRFKWLLYKSLIKVCDFNFFYRPDNLQKAINQGIHNPNLLLPYFRPWNEKNIELKNNDVIKYQADVVFIGHYENDGRDSMLIELVNAGINVKLWGDESWIKAKNPEFKKYFKNIETVYDCEYTKALNGGKICLNFLSKVNNDVLTRRCFEIPACNCLLLSERTDFLSSQFLEDEEAVYFSNAKELIKKIQWLLSDNLERERIAKNGYNKVLKNHSVFNRAKEFLNTLY